MKPILGQNPILNFRKKVEGLPVLTEDNYDIKMGGRIDSSRKLLVGSGNFNSSTMVTLTREAIDSSNENSD